MTRARRGGPALWLLTGLPLLLGGLCEGDGATLPGVVRQQPLDPRCAPLAGRYPSGFDLLPGAGARAAVMQFVPAKLLAFDLGTAPPALLSPALAPPFPSDSDGDGQDDAVAYAAAGLCPPINPGCRTRPVPGSVNAAFADLVFVTTSGYEQVLFYEPLSGSLQTLLIENPTSGGAHLASDWPLLPPEGEAHLRTAISSKTCLYPPQPVDSLGGTIDPDPQCGAAPGGFLTRLTSASALAAGRLFVASANLKSSSSARFYPGSVLVYDFDIASGVPSVRPDAVRGALFTSAFNPTGLTTHTNAAGRELVLVTETGAISAGGELLTEGAVDVIDAATLRVAARIPLGLAGPAFGPIAIDPGRRVGLLGAESRRQLLAIDLAPLDDPALYGASGPPVVLDGTTPGFADARIASADSPIELPARSGGPPTSLCAPRTNVAIDDAGQHAYATDWCDGTLIVLDLDLEVPRDQPITRERFTVQGVQPLLAPKLPATNGLLAAPSMPRVRRGRPGIDFEGPDVFFVANEPEAQLCAVRIAP